MYCNQCGTELRKEANFCNHCGTVVSRKEIIENVTKETTAETITIPPEKPTNSPTLPGGPYKAKSFFTVLAGIIMILGAIAGLFMNSYLMIFDMGIWVLFFLLHHIYCRSKYKETRAILQTGLIKKWSAKMYYNFTITAIILPMYLFVFFRAGFSNGGGLFGIWPVIALFAIVYAVIFIPKARLKKKYGQEKANEIIIAMLRLAAGEPFLVTYVKRLLSIVGIMSYVHLITTPYGKEYMRYVGNGVYETMYGERYYVN